MFAKLGRPHFCAAIQTAGELGNQAWETEAFCQHNPVALSAVRKGDWAAASPRYVHEQKKLQLPLCSLPIISVLA
jgi:hypothetical protein